MYNSDGYVLIDLTGVDITKTNQHLTGIYNRVLTVIDINKLALVINAGDLTPMAAVVHKRLNYYVINTPLYIFTINSNDIIMIEEAGEATVDVAIVPTLLDGVKIADFTIGSVEGSLYAPEQQSEINDNITTDYTTWSSDKINTALSSKANTADVYTKAQVDTALSAKADTSDIPTKTSQLQNDSGFITSAQAPTIDDSSVSSSSVWSSYKTSAELGNKANTSALSDYQTKTDNTLATTDKTVVGAINELNGINNYSTIEKAIGKWTDGKTIYRKVLTDNFGNSMSLNIDSGVEIDTLVYISIKVIKGKIIFELPFRNEISANEYYQGYSFVNLQTSGNSALVTIIGSSSSSTYFNNCDIQIVIEYTKHS